MKARGRDRIVRGALTFRHDSPRRNLVVRAQA